MLLYIIIISIILHLLFNLLIPIRRHFFVIQVGLLKQYNYHPLLLVIIDIFRTTITWLAQSSRHTHNGRGPIKVDLSNFDDLAYYVLSNVTRTTVRCIM